MPNRLARKLSSPAAVLGASMFVTVLATVAAAATVQGRVEARFATAVQSTHDRIESRLATYGALLQATAAFVSATGYVTRAGFNDYAQQLRVRQHYPGIQGIGITWRMMPEEVPEVERRIRAEGDTGFRVWPDTAREEFHSIIHLEPLDRRNLAAIGFDMFSEPVRREAMSRARDTGMPAASGRVQLVQEIDERKQAGFLMYAPLYSGGRDPVDVESRRRLLQGFVYAPFRADDLFEGIFGRELEPRVSFQIYDAETADPASIIHDSRGSAMDGVDLPPPTRWWFPLPVSTGQLENAGRTWTLVFTATPALARNAGLGMVPLVALSGTIVGILLFGLAQTQARDRLQIEQTAAELETLTAELRIRNDELAAANRSKSEFLAVMSHETRTPINAIIGYTQLLEIGLAGPVNEEQREQLRRITASGKHLLRLVDDILDLSRIEAGRLDVAREARLASSVTDLALTLIRPQADARGIAIEVACADGRAQFLGDEQRVHQILLNLLSNAVKFTPRGGRITVDCGTTEEGPEVLEEFRDGDGGWTYFAVADTGVGIRGDLHDQIFEPFVQGESGYNRPHGGTGLGLAISRRLARMMGGDLTVESEEGKGARFVLWLPAPTDATVAAR